jgi:hypothetical protein
MTDDQIKHMVEGLPEAAEIICLRNELEQVKRALEIKTRREETSHKFWMRAGRSALNGDLSDLRIRIGSFEEPPAAVVSSLKEGGGE